MVTDLRRWRGFGSSLRVARVEAGLLLRDIGLRSVSVLSRIENESTAPSRDVVERYSLLCGRPDIIADFHTRENSVVEAEADPTSFTSVTRLTHLEVTVDVGRVVTLWERRTIVATKPLVRRTRLLSHMTEVDGEVPMLLGVRGYGVRITGHEWVDEHVHAIDFDLPAEMRPGDPEYTFQLVREYDRMAPRFTQTATYPFSFFRLIVSLPGAGWRILVVNGLPQPMVAPALEAAVKGRPHPLQVRHLRESEQITVEFKNVAAGLSYGLAWLPPTS